MTKSEFTERLAKRWPQFVLEDVELVVRVVFAAMAETLAKHERIEIRNFGAFTVRLQQARKGRNPMTGAVVQVPAKLVPYFRPGTELRERVDPPG